MFEAIGLDLTWHGPAARPVAPPRPPGAGPGPGPLARHGRAALRHPAGPDSEFRPGDVLDSYFRPVPAAPAVLLPDAPGRMGARPGAVDSESDGIRSTLDQRARFPAAASH